MKTIKERAERYVRRSSSINLDLNYPEEQEIYCDDVWSAFIAGAKSEHEELTRWHDPKEELPDYYHPVEIKYLHSQFIEVAIAWLGVIDDGAYIWTIDNTDKCILHHEIIGWREILE